MNQDSAHRSKSATPARGRPKEHRTARVVRDLAGVLAGLMLIAGIELAVALLTPSQDSVLARGAEWARSRGLGDLVSAAEWTAYQFNPPQEGGAPAAIPADGPPGGYPGRHNAGSGGCPTAALASPAANPLPNEGVWQPIETVQKNPVIFAAFVRPDSQHTSFLAGVTCTDHTGVRFTLHPGTQVPGSTGWAESPTVADIPPRELLATFNSGFRMDDSRGGFWMAGKSVGSLIAGRASMVFTQDGRLDVRAWEGGRPASGIVAVRQNLSLLVDSGQVTDAVLHSYIYYDHRGALKAKKLTSDQVAAATRYLETSIRDFVSVRSRHRAG